MTMTCWERTAGGMHATFTTQYEGTELAGRTRTLGWQAEQATEDKLQAMTPERREAAEFQMGEAATAAFHEALAAERGETAA